MAGFTPVFGASVIYPSDTTYLPLVMTVDVTLNWPLEQQIGGDNIVADIMDLSASIPGLSVIVPDATQATTGFTALFNNVGAQTVSIKDPTGGTIVSLASGTSWQIYLTDNTTPAGVWRTFQYGASVSVNNAAALAGAGLKAITTTLNEQITIATKAINYVILEADRAKAIIWTAGAGTFTLPDPSVVGSDWFTIIKNSGSGDLVVSPPGGSTIDGVTSKTFAAGDSCWIVSAGGTQFYSIGFGSTSGSGSSSFAYTTINVAGAGNYTLSGAELNKISYRLTGLLTGARAVIVPTAVQQYWINNATTGAFALQVKTAAGTGITVAQGSSAILYCDGVNVVIAQSTGTTFPITIGQGGTNATTAAGARTNLGSSATGDAIFTAANGAAVLALIGGASSATVISAGTGLSGGGDLSANRSFSLANPIYSAYKATNTDRSSTVVPANDPDLVLSNIPIGAYEIDLYLAFGGVVSSTPGIVIQLSASGTITTGSIGPRYYSNGSGVLLPRANISGGVISVLSLGAIAPFVETDYTSVPGILISSTIFTLAVQWSQNSSNAQATRMNAGSYLILRKVG